MNASAYLIGYLWAALAYHLAGHGLFAFYRARKKGPMTHTDFTKDSVWFGRLQLYGIHGGHLTFTHARSGRTFSICKHSPNIHERKIILVLRVADLNEDGHAKLHAYCDTHKLSMETRKEGQSEEIETIHVNCGNSVVEAYDLALEIWTKMLHARAKATYTLNFSGIEFNNPKLGTLDWPVAISFIGLTLSTLFTIGATPEWTAPLGRAALSGSAASLLFFIAFFATVPLASFHRRLPHLILSLMLRIYGYGRILFGLTLPIAVLLVWAGAAD